MKTFALLVHNPVITRMLISDIRGMGGGEGNLYATTHELTKKT